jgi:TonB family protein
MMLVTLLSVAILAAQTQAPERDTVTELAAARQLYAAASYEEALDRLGRLTAPGPLADQVDTYRALCLLALGRTRESEALVQRILERNPKFVVDEREVSPRLVMVFRSVRARLLPATVRNLYAAARASFDKRDYDNAVVQLREVLALLDAESGAESGVGDLRVLAEGFLKQAEFLQSGGAPPSSKPSNRTVTDVGPRGEPIFSVLDRDVIAPVEISRPVPIMETPRGGQAGLYQGLVEIVIGETGRVEQVAIRKSIHPAFDAEIIAAIGFWRFQPATKDRKPVKYRRSYEIIGHSK